MSVVSKITIALLDMSEGIASVVGKLFTVLPTNTSADPSVVRLSNTATRINSSGECEVVPANKGRISFETGLCPCLLVEDTHTNLFLNPLTPVTQSITVILGSVYTISVIGVGSVVLSGAGLGTVTQNNPITITASSTTLTCTISGTLSGVSVVLGYVPLSVAIGTANEDVITKNTSLLNDIEFLFAEAYLQNAIVEPNKFYSLASVSNVDNTIGYTIGRINNTIVFVNQNGEGFQYAIPLPIRFGKIKACGQIASPNVFYVNGVQVTTTASFLQTSISNWNGCVISEMIGHTLTAQQLEELTTL